MGNVLNDYVTVTSFPKDILFSSYSFIPDTYLNPETLLYLPIKKMENAIIRQLQQGISVWLQPLITI